MKIKYFAAYLAVLLGIPALAHAQNPAEWVLETGHVIGGSSVESGARLMDPVIMDFDGDGYQDVIFGAPGTSPNGIVSAGSIYVIRGKKDWDLTGKLDVTYWNSFDYRFDGHTPGGMLGLNLMTGDFNGDGFIDLAAAEPGANGAVYIFYGGKQRDKGIYDITQNLGADVAFISSENGSNLGISGCIGDFNRDGIDDLALSQISKNAALGNNTSLVTILAMRKSWDKKSYDIGSKINGKTVLSRPVSYNTRVVHNCAVGDFNDDGLTDIALGMPLDTYQKQKSTGSVTLVYNPHKYNGTIVDLSSVDEKVGLRINGSQAGAQFGYSLAAGDFTGDGRDDLAISAPNRLVKGPANEGAIYLYDANHFPTETAEQPETIQFTGNGGAFGYKLQAADVNGDHRPDLVVQAPSAGSLKNGTVSVWLGGPHFNETVASSPRPDIEISGDDFMGFGYGAAFGDINADGKIDAVIRTSADPMRRPVTGAQTVISAFQDLPQTSTLSADFLTIQAPSRGGGLSPDLKIVDYMGKKYRAWFSPKGFGNRSIICLKDVEQSLSDDLAVSAQDQCNIQIIGPEKYYISDFAITQSKDDNPLLTIAVPDMPVKTATGFVAVIPLPEEIDKPLVLNLTENTLKSDAQTYILSDEPASSLGKHIEWKDLDQDGQNDLIIGAPKRLIDEDVSGSVFVVKSPDTSKKGFHELTAADVIQFEGFANEELGSTWTTLDFNGDGALDLLIQAAHSPDASGEEYATIYAIYSAGAKAPRAYNVKSPDMSNLRIISAQNRAGLEIVPIEVDLNQDGLNDLFLISRDYRAGLQKQGIFYAITSNTKNKSGEFHLDKESLIAFTYTPGRNEKLIDARFVYVNEKLNFLVDSADILTGQQTSIELLSEKEDEPYQGTYTTSLLNRVRQEARIPKSVQIVHIPDPEKKNDEIWFLYTHDGLVQSDQGIAQKVK